LVPRADGCSARPGPVGLGVVVDELLVVVVVEDELVVELDELVDVEGVEEDETEGEVEVEVKAEDGVVVDDVLAAVLVELDVVLVVVEVGTCGTVIVLVLVVVDVVAVPVPESVTQVSTSEPATGTVSWEIGTPTGSGNWKVWPVRVVTVRVQSSAEAVGRDTDAIQIRKAATVTRTAPSRRLALTARSFSSDHHCSTALPCVVLAPLCGVR
jgi:hypothetical protein